MDNQLSVAVEKWPKLVRECSIERYRPLMGLSAPGCGKSDGMIQAAEQWALDEGKRLWLWDTPGAVPSGNEALGFCETIWSQHDPTDLKFPALLNGEFVQAYSTELPLEGNEKRFTPEGLWACDEITNVEPFMGKALMQLVLERRIGSRRVLPGWRIVAAGNRLKDRAYAQVLSPTLASRFTIVNLEPTLDGWVAWAFKKGIHPLLVAFLRNYPQLLHKFDYTSYAAGEYAFPCPRQWAALSPFVDMADTDTRTIIFAGSVGSAAAGQAEAYFRVWQKLPDLDRIEKTGEGTVPTERDGGGILIGLTTALVYRATEKNLPNVFKYVGKLPSEFQSLFAKDLLRKNPLFSVHAAYNAWCATQKV